MFLSLLKGEFKKLLKPRSVVILGIVIAIALILTIVVFSLFLAVPELQNPDEMLPANTFYGLNVSEIKSEADADELLSVYNQALQIEEANKAKDPNGYYSGADNIYSLKSCIKAIEYVKANNLYGQDISFYLGESGAIIKAVTGEVNGYDFAEFAMSFLQVILTVYLITVAAGIMVNELKSGSIKLLLLRPVTKNALTSAKLAAMALYGLALFTITLLLAFLYGAVRYGAPIAPTLFVFNAQAAFLAPRGFGLFLTFISGASTMLMLSLFAYAVAVVFKNVAAGMGAAIISLLGVVQMLFNMFGGGRFLLSATQGFTQYFSTGNTSLYGGSSFDLMIGMLAVYAVLFIAASYFVFHKRDVV